MFQVLHYANLIVAHAPIAWTALMYISTIFFMFIEAFQTVICVKCDLTHTHNTDTCGEGGAGKTWQNILLIKINVYKLRKMESL